jgi:16S rRNA (guanine966-N2)-methyltransferase
VTRIIAGTARGRRLEVPAGQATRPTSDRVREALFSRLQHEGLLDGARVLDLYAGSGARGLEAASRGAEHVLLVDSARAAVASARRNATTVATAGVEVRQAPVSVVLGTAPGSPYDVVFLDQPYPLPEEELSAVLSRLVDHEWLAPDAVVVVERSHRSPEPAWPDGLVRFDERRYGETRLWLAEPITPPAPA